MGSVKAHFPIRSKIETDQKKNLEYRRNIRNGERPGTGATRPPGVPAYLRRMERTNREEGWKERGKEKRGDRKRIQRNKKIEALERKIGGVSCKKTVPTWDNLRGARTITLSVKKWAQCQQARGTTEDAKKTRYPRQKALLFKGIFKESHCGHVKKSLRFGASKERKTSSTQA